MGCEVLRGYGTAYGYFTSMYVAYGALFPNHSLHETSRNTTAPTSWDISQQACQCKEVRCSPFHILKTNRKWRANHFGLNSTPIRPVGILPIPVLKKNAYAVHKLAGVVFHRPGKLSRFSPVEEARDRM